MTRPRLTMAGTALLATLLLTAPGPANAALDVDKTSAHDVLHLLDSQPNAPALLVRAAREARREGRLVDAAWFTDHVLRLPNPDASAVAEGRALGWDVPDANSTSETAPLTPAWPWWFGALLCLGALAVTAARRQDVVGGSALLVGVVAAALVMPPTVVPRPTLPPSLATIADGAPCPSGPLTWRGGKLWLAATCPRGLRQVVVSPLGAGDRAITRTASHSVAYLGDGGEPEVQALVRHVVSAIAAAEATGYIVPSRVSERPSRLARWQGADPVSRIALRVSAGLVAATLWVLLSLLLPLLRGLFTGAVPRSLLIPMGLAAAGLLLVPAKMRMVYGGYDLTTHLVDGVVPRYGPGALWFYGLPQWFISPDHSWIQGLNRLYGLGSLVAVVALAGRWFSTGARQATAWLVATLPIWFAAHSCESIHAGPVLGILVSVWLWSADEVRHPVAATLPWLAAACTRPEMALMAVFAPVLVWALRGRPARPFEGPWRLLIGGAAVLLGVVAWELLATTGQMASNAAIDLGPGLLGKVLTAATFGSIFAAPTMTPTVLLGLVVVAWVQRETTRIAPPVILFALLWMAVTGIDHAIVSLPRIQLGPLLLCLPIAGAVAVSLRDASKPLIGALCLFYALGLAYSAVALWAPTNEDHEEALWREVAEVLPEGPLCLAAVGYGDAPGAGLSPRHNPSYLLGVRNPPLAVRNLAHIERFSETCQGPVYALLGMRCHVAMRTDNAPAPGSEGIKACRQLRATGRLQPVVERDVPNRGDLAYPMYPAASQLTIGLYTVKDP